MPYGSTDCEWDNVPDLIAWWTHIERVTTEGAKIVLFAAQPFTPTLINPCPKWFRYNLTWDKVIAVGHLNANRQPMRVHEQIVIFCRKPSAGVYIPQFTSGKPYRTKKAAGKNSQVYRAANAYSSVNRGRRHPTSILRFAKPSNRDRLHPTEKPVALLNWLMRSYSKPGQTILDTFMGSRLTIEAAIAAGRYAIGIERDVEIHATACKRLHRTTAATRTGSEC